MPRATPLVVLLLLLVAASPPAAADAHEGTEAEPAPADPSALVLSEDTEWEDGTVLRARNVTVEENVTLRIRGARVTLDDVALRVEANGTLLVESVDGRPSVITGGEKGWNVLTVRGTVLLHGAPDARIVLEGLSGESGFGGGSTALFVGGLSAGRAVVEARHVVVRNYTAGILLGDGTTGTLDDLHLSEGRGIGLAMTASALHLGNSTFSGVGGTVFASVPPGGVRLDNLTFTDVENALTLRGAFSEVAGIRVTNASACITTLGFNDLKLRGMECTGFRTAAIATETTVTSRTPTTRLDIDGLVASTEHVVEGIVLAKTANTIRIRNSTLGPVMGDGVVASGVVPEYQNVRFQGVTGYAAVYVNPAENSTFDVPGTGEPGDRGWVRVVRQSPLRLVNEDGADVLGARIDIRHERTGLLAFSNRSLGESYLRPGLDVLVIDANGTRHDATYLVAVGNETAGALLREFEPTFNETRVVLQAGASPFVPPKRSPDAGLALVLVGIAALALALRRR